MASKGAGYPLRMPTVGRTVALLVLLWPLLAAAACTRPLRVPFEDWRPYSFVDSAGRHTGLETELLAAVAKQMGCEVEYVHELPRNRRLPMLAAGELDLLVAASVDDDAAARTAWWYTRPYRDEELSAFVLAESPLRYEVQTLADLLLSRQRLIAQRGPSIVPAVDQFGVRGLLTQFEDYAKGVELLKRGRGDVLIGDRLALLAAAEASGVALAELPLPVRRDAVSYKLSRKRFSQADLDGFNEAIRRLETQGELQRIRTRWLDAGRRGR